MKTIKLTHPHTMNIKELPETVTAIGFFDGIHKGHQQVIDTAVNIAKEKGMKSAVITFHPHPSVVLSKGKKKVNYITPLKEKESILQNMQVDRLYIIEFNEKLAALSPQKFIDQFIIGLNIKHVVAGFDFTYGHKGQGNMTTIKDQTRDEFTFTTIEKVQMNGEKVSSTLIRGLLKKGNIEQVNLLLGRPLSIYGKVIEGAKRGKSLGYPTANLAVDEQALLPKPGIYAVKISYKNEQYHGMASLGTNPTFTDSHNLSLEVNILDFNDNLYGEELKMEWYKFIREEEKYSNVDKLIEQIKEDEEIIRQVLDNKDILY
ncbi:bifunctional riboflavin kinase/FAD synthetase [Virgibacillus sp. MSJ-26]|uniref:bifunctional riboflavin kinase/FAD synthetase n=1 Tax=Virgibacillus sp. MSJ-26 TaxID=2841522 RepID=UPI001C0FA2ED|nr:bifunctional riboflavin kinase/FAD synthetase [Virgibacillus sp. MSJ-26]MBU5466733.1 bifunctional riboflavin kinase/FAD synthetase [Virgibacillus sp. MSJ-26]